MTETDAEKAYVKLQQGQGRTSCTQHGQFPDGSKLHGRAGRLYPCSPGTARRAVPPPHSGAGGGRAHSARGGSSPPRRLPVRQPCNRVVSATLTRPRSVLGRAS